MKKLVLFCMLGMCAVALPGCGDKNKQKREEVYISEYEKITYETTEVVKGDIVPVLSLDLECDSFERKNYFPIQDEMEVEQVYVTEGDVVKEGDVLISFKSGDIDDQISGYEDTLGQQKLLLDHYTNLSLIDTNTDYTEQINMLKADMEVTSLYISELEAKLASYSIVAEGQGTILSISDYLELGPVNSNDNIITVIYGTGDYYATTTDDYQFEIGKIYEATYAKSVYSLELVSVEDAVDESGNKVQNLHFAIAMGGVTEVSRMTMDINKPALKNVLYVPSECVFNVDEEYYAYTIDENGFREAVPITIGESIDGMTIIESGLSEGDKVVIN